MSQGVGEEMLRFWIKVGRGKGKGEKGKERSVDI